MRIHHPFGEAELALADVPYVMFSNVFPGDVTRQIITNSLFCKQVGEIVPQPVLCVMAVGTLEALYSPDCFRSFQ